MDRIIEAIDEEIARLQRVRNLLAKNIDDKPTKRRGRRRLSANGRARIAEGQRKRWARQKKNS
jgi:hypothetical protein